VIEMTIAPSGERALVMPPNLTCHKIVRSVPHCRVLPVLEP